MKSIIITGASSGIGQITAKKFLAAGWRVGLIARRVARLDELAGQYENAVVLAADVTDERAVAAAFSRFTAKDRRLDALFNNAGTFGKSGTIDEISVDEFRKVVDINLTGMFICARAAFAQMRGQTPQGGRIINNGSISAHVPRPHSVAYTTTKHAISGLTKTLSLDGRGFDIACGQIDIGNAATAMTSVIESGVLQADGSVRAEPVMQATDVAAAVLTMASLPPGANIQSMTIMATQMPYIGRG